jgi:hypothetical protein
LTSCLTSSYATLASGSEDVPGTQGSGGRAVTGVVGIVIAVAGVLGPVREAQNPPSAKAFLIGPAVAERGVAGPEDIMSHRRRGVVGDEVSMRGRCAGRSGCAPVGAVSEEEL